MSDQISSIRDDYKRDKLDTSHVDENPFIQFKKWLDEAIAAKVPEPTAVALSTSTQDGRPSSRMVLLKEVSDAGFTFYTNYESRKGSQMMKNPFAAMTFFWPELERQVNVSGRIEKISSEESDLYFQTRPRKSRIGAWASHQSRELSSRRELISRYVKFSMKYAGQQVPLPPFWGGLKLIPERIEFWQGRPSRLHDRIEFSRELSGAWKISRLSP